MKLDFFRNTGFQQFKSGLLKVLKHVFRAVRKYLSKPNTLAVLQKPTKFLYPSNTHTSKARYFNQCAYGFYISSFP